MFKYSRSNRFVLKKKSVYVLIHLYTKTNTFFKWKSLHFRICTRRFGPRQNHYDKTLFRVECSRFHYASIQRKLFQTATARRGGVINILFENEQRFLCAVLTFIFHFSVQQQITISFDKLLKLCFYTRVPVMVLSCISYYLWCSLPALPSCGN